MIDWSIVARSYFVDDKECIVCIPVTEKHGMFYTIHRQTINGITPMQMMLRLEGKLLP